MAPAALNPGAPVAVLSDVHGNAPAFRAVVDDVISLGCATSYVLGDIINGVDPQGAFDLLGRLPDARCLKGNAEQYLVTPGLERVDQLYPGSTAVKVVPLLMWIRCCLSDASITTIESWPDSIVEEGRWYVHDSVEDRLHRNEWETEGVLPEHQELMHHSRGYDRERASRERDRLHALMDQYGIQELYLGHTHRAFVLEIGDRLVCNPGSVGMPLDGDWRASWLLLEPVGDPDRPPAVRRRATIRRVSYDLAATLKRIDGLAHEYPDFRSAADVERYKQRLQQARSV